LPGVSLGPIASGLPKDLVNQLVDAQREPIRQLEARKQNEEARLKLAQDLLGKISSVNAGISEISRFKQFRDLTATVGRPELMDVSVDKNLAEVGNYNIEVLQLSGRSSMMSNGMPDPNDTEMGAGYFSYELPSGEVREVYIDPDNSTLEGIAKVINSTKDLNLHAIVVDDGTLADNPWRLIVSHNRSGEINDAEFPQFYFLDGDEDFILEDERPAQNSVIKVNGFPVEFEGNKITSLLPGVTIDLKDAAPGKEFTLSIGEDVKSIKGKVKALVFGGHVLLDVVFRQGGVCGQAVDLKAHV
jgi:flagellar hook-associated protein 2